MPSERADGLVSRRTALRFFASAAGVALLAACQAPAPATSCYDGARAQTNYARPSDAASSAAASTDRPAQAGFLPVGVSTVLNCAGHGGQGPAADGRNAAHRQPGRLAQCGRALDQRSERHLPRVRPPG